MNYVVSSADSNQVSRQATILRLRPYLDRIYTFSHDGVNSAEEFKAETVFSTICEVIQKYSTTPEGIILIGDTSIDMQAAQLAKQKIRKHAGLDPRFESVDISAVLFDPNLRNNGIEADARIRRLDDVLYLDWLF